MKKSSICYDCKFAKETEDKFTCLLLDLEAPVKECDWYLPPVGRYDGVTTAKELIGTIARNGLSTQQYDLNRAADILGNENINVLAEIATSDTEVCGKSVSRVFYSTIFRIWNWEQAIRFYNEHTLKIQVLKNKLEAAETGCKLYHEEREYHFGEITRFVAMEREYESAKIEIINLKAKLYDLMTAGA